MWAIFIAIFGGLFWAFKIGADRAASKQSDQKLEQARITQDHWYEQVKDYNLETEIRTEPGTPAFRTQCDGAIAFIRTLPGLENANFDFGARRKSSFYVSQFVLYLEMVKRGKLPAMFITELGNYIELSLDTRPSKKARIAFGKWVESTLKAHGVKGANLYYTKKDYASFEWEPFIYDLSDAIRVDDPDLESQMIG